MSFFERFRKNKSDPKLDVAKGEGARVVRMRLRV